MTSKHDVSGHDNSPPVPKLALTRAEAARSIGVSVRTVDALIADRSSGFPVVNVFLQVLVPVDLLKAWLAARVKEGDR